MSEEIDFKRLYKSLLRKKKFIISFTFISIVFSLFYAIRQEHIWRGKFQIVLDTKYGTSSLRNSLPKNFSNIGSLINSNNETNIQTQVEILKSPSVLFPVFELSKSIKQQEGNFSSELPYRDWIKNLNVELVQGTVILEVSYTNTDKESIIPILDKISRTYAGYSINNRKIANANNVNFLNLQIKNYKSKTLNSIRIAEEYSNKYNLSPISTNNGQPIGIGSSQEEIILASNRENNFLYDLINIIEKDLEFTSNEDKLKTISNALVGVIDIRLNPILIEIKEVEASLAKSEGLLTKNDITIKRLIKRKEELFKNFKESLIGIIKTKIELNNSQILSNDRDDGIFTQYRELIREVQRNELTLADLENQKNTILLNSQIISEPWEMITKPDLEKFPVGPRKKRMVLLGSLLGFFVSSIVGILSDKKRDLIYNIDEIQKLLDFNLIDTLNMNDKDFLIDVYNFL